MNPEDFNRLFETRPDRYPSRLEKGYPRILAKVLELWESPEEEEAYLRDLVVDLRGNRAGFPPEVMQELLYVSELHSRWRADRRKVADRKILQKIAPELVGEIEKGMRALTAEGTKELAHAKALIQKDDPSVIWWMSQKHLNINQKDRDGQTPLMYAAQAGAEKCAMALMQSGGNPHVVDVTGNTPLHWAVVMRKFKLVEILLYYGSNPNAKNKAGATPFSLSSIHSDAAIARRLYDYGADPSWLDNAGNTPLHKAVMGAKKEMVKFLLTLGVSLETRNGAGQTVEMLAKDPEIRALLEAKRKNASRQGM